jgi:hypothetical protein
MKLYKTNLIVQSNTTGRFLLIFKNAVWQFAFMGSGDGGQLYEAMEQTRQVVGEHVVDSVQYLSTNQPKTHSFHAWVEGEPQYAESPWPTAWHALFDFPESTHPGIEAIVRDPYFMDHIIKPI